MVTGSDDFTLFLWEPVEGKKPVARLTGHQQLINRVRILCPIEIVDSSVPMFMKILKNSR